MNLSYEQLKNYVMVLRGREYQWFCDASNEALVLKNVTMGGGDGKLRDFIDGWPLPLAELAEVDDDLLRDVRGDVNLRSQAGHAHVRRVGWYGNPALTTQAEIKDIFIWNLCKCC